MLNNWSFSRLMQYEACPMRVKLKVIDRCPEPPPDPKSPLERGNREHDRYERYVKGDTSALDNAEARQLAFHRPNFDKLAELYAAGMATAEDNWKFDADWNVIDGDTRDYWLFAKLDAYVYDPEQSLVIAIDFKGFPLDTKIPTPSGFTTMDEVRVGDHVFDMHGITCQVTGKSHVKHLDCYRITFDDTTTVDCDAEHLWRLVDDRVVPVTALLRNDRIPTAGALQLPDAALPIDPYVFGLWLADGKHTSGEVSKPDAFVWEEIQRRGYEIGTNTGRTCPTRTVKGIRGHLSALGVLGNKHIPASYMRASEKQRIDLLRGLCDGDGYANPVRRQVNLNFANKTLSDQVVHLLRTLGQRPLQSTTQGFGFGKSVTAYPINFRPRNFVPFLLPRKAAGVAEWGEGRAGFRRVVSVARIPSVPTQCIAVNSPSRTFLVTEQFVPTHNTGRSDYKTIEHVQQLQLYNALSALRNEDADRFISENWYVDEQYVRSFELTREEALRYVGRFQKRADTMLNDKTFRPNPNKITCKYCPFSPRGSGACPVGV